MNKTWIVVGFASALFGYLIYSDYAYENALLEKQTKEQEIATCLSLNREIDLYEDVVSRCDILQREAIKLGEEDKFTNIMLDRCELTKKSLSRLYKLKDSTNCP